MRLHEHTKGSPCNAEIEAKTIERFTAFDLSGPTRAPKWC
jgi:hypothetical protein